jgi:hypothetical protein
MHYVKYLPVDDFWKYLRYGAILGTIIASAFLGVPYWGMLLIGFTISMLTEPFVRDDIKEVFIRRDNYQNQPRDVNFENLRGPHPYVIRDAAFRRKDRASIENQHALEKKQKQHLAYFKNL